MDLKDIASMAGKSGLFKVLKPSKSGVILESMDEKKQKFVAGVHQKVSILDEISVYVKTSEGSIPLDDVFQRILKEFDDDPGVDPSSTPDEFKAFFKHILPEFDESKVYTSDMKKIIKWYSILLREAPEIIKKPQAKSDKKSVKKDEMESAPVPKNVKKKEPAKNKDSKKPKK